MAQVRDSKGHFLPTTDVEKYISSARRLEKQYTSTKTYQRMNPNGYRQLTDQELEMHFKYGKSARDVIWATTHGTDRETVALQKAALKASGRTIGIKETNDLNWGTEAGNTLLRDYAREINAKIKANNIAELPEWMLEDEDFINYFAQGQAGVMERSKAAAKYISYKLWGSP